MADDTVTLEFLARPCQQSLQESKALRGEVADIRRLALQTIDYVRRLDRRMSGQRDDLELAVKSELSGGMAHMQTQLESYLRPINDKLLEMDKLAERVGALEGTR